MTTRLVLGMALLAACGRLQFDPVPARDAGDGDAIDSFTPGDSDSDATPIDAAPASARSVTAGRGHSCAIRDGELSCWGDNVVGQLGLGDVTERLIPTRVQPASLWRTVAAGATHTCAIRDDATLWCWGENINGQLGIGATPPSSTVALQVTLAGPVRTVASRFESTCAVLADGSLWCWGVNSEGQLGQGGTSGPVRTPVRVGNAATWSFVATGQGHMLGIRGGMAAGAGRNSEAELGLGAGQPTQVLNVATIDAGPWRTLSAGQQASAGVRGDQTLWSWGENGGPLGLAVAGQRDVPTLVDGTPSWIDAQIDTFHGCGIVAGAMRCWGRNTEGQLGRGDNVSTLTPVASGAITDWERLAVARFHNCAQRGDGSVWCTGDNATGMLGTNDRTRRNAWTQVTLP